jgi:hypothetical protein
MSDHGKFFGSVISREIWGNPETVILAYVGSAADFALNSENDWLFFTGRLPNSPQQRFMETFKYNKMIFNMPEEKVPQLMQQIRAIHTRIENSRSAVENKEMHMSNRAFVEVGDMLIDYGIRGYEYIHSTKLPSETCELYFHDMKRLYELMGVNIQDASYGDFLVRRAASVKNDLQVNEKTTLLYEAYRKDLGWWKYQLLRQFQAYFVPEVITQKIGLRKQLWFAPLYAVYPYIRNFLLFELLIGLVLRPDVRKTIYQMESEYRHHAPAS